MRSSSASFSSVRRGLSFSRDASLACGEAGKKHAATCFPSGAGCVVGIWVSPRVSRALRLRKGSIHTKKAPPRGRRHPLYTTALLVGPCSKRRAPRQPCPTSTMHLALRSAGGRARRSLLRICACAPCTGCGAGPARPRARSAGAHTGSPAPLPGTLRCPACGEAGACVHGSHRVRGCAVHARVCGGGGGHRRRRIKTGGGVRFQRRRTVLLWSLSQGNLLHMRYAADGVASTRAIYKSSRPLHSLYRPLPNRCVQHSTRMLK